MKRIYVFLILLIFSGQFFLSCVNDELQINQENNFKLKSGVLISPNCSEESIDLLVGRSKSVGKISVSNDFKYLQVVFLPHSSYKFLNVSLWVGTTALLVPKNSKGVPIPAKFRYKESGQDEYIFQIRLSDIYSIDPESAFEVKNLSIFANAEIDNIETPDIEKETAWSDGNTFGKVRWGTYSNYTTCDLPTGGGGCFPHIAFCGNYNLPGGYYFYTGGGIQNVIADNGAIAGNIDYNGGKLIISLRQDWMLAEVPDKAPVKVMSYLDVPQEIPPSYSTYTGSELAISVDGSKKYFIIHLDLQQCFTTNP